MGLALGNISGKSFSSLRNIMEVDRALTTGLGCGVTASEVLQSVSPVGVPVSHQWVSSNSNY